MRAGGGHAHISMAFGRGEALALFKGALFIGPQTPTADPRRGVHRQPRDAHQHARQERRLGIFRSLNELEDRNFD